jgi:uncharacterized protein YdaU (DUF1376 family)
MKINKLPFIRWYASDFLAGTRGLKAFEIGIYTILLNLMYERCEPLPIDIGRLSRQCGCTKKSLSQTLELLKEDEKIIIKDGGLWNNRVEQEFFYRQNKISAAKQSANARWKKPNENNGDGMRTQADRNAAGMLSQKPEARSHKEKKEDTNVSPKERGDEIMKLWNKTCPEFTQVLSINKNRLSQINQLYKDYLKTIDDWGNYFKKYPAAPLLSGAKGDWKATFDWSLKPANVIKVLEGNYDENSKSTHKDDWSERVEMFKQTGNWLDELWGPPPNHKNTRVPTSLKINPQT